MKSIAKHLIPNAGTLVIVGLLFLAQSAGALPGVTSAEPLAPSQTLISYQGTLTDKGGNPVNATVSMEFALYDAATGGNLLWGPETQAVSVSDGLFHVLLGSVAPIAPATLSGDLWLGITVNGELLSPRELLVSVAHAVEASAISGDLEMSGNQINAIGDMDFGASVGKKAYWYGSTYYTGIEQLTLYEVSSRYFRWYNAATGPDGGASDVMQIDASTGNMEVQGGIGVGGAGSFGTGVNVGGNLLVSGSSSLWGDVGMHGNLWLDKVLYATGGVNCGALTEANLQTPEEQAAGRIDRFEEGDVLCWGTDRLERCATPNDPLVQAVADTEGRPIVIGAEAVKVLGPVVRGDYLVASGVPGYAMALPNPTFGIVIAQALEDLYGERGTVKAMIRKM
jgi:hypothetical protein